MFERSVIAAQNSLQRRQHFRLVKDRADRKNKSLDHGAPYHTAIGLGPQLICFALQHVLLDPLRLRIDDPIFCHIVGGIVPEFGAAIPTSVEGDSTSTTRAGAGNFTYSGVKERAFSGPK